MSVLFQNKWSLDGVIKPSIKTGSVETGLYVPLAGTRGETIIFSGFAEAATQCSCATEPANPSAVSTHTDLLEGDGAHTRD